MSESSTYPLRLPKPLKDKVAQVAKRDGTSLNQFIAIAVAEKAKNANLQEFKNILFRNGGEKPMPDDLID